MEGNSAFYGFLLNNCLSGIEFDREERRYCVRTKHYTSYSFKILQQEAKNRGFHLTQNSFNSFLKNIRSIYDLPIEKSYNNSLPQSDILTGEELKVYSTQDSFIRILKMKNKEFLILDKDVVDFRLNVDQQQDFSEGETLLINGKEITISRLKIVRPNKWHRLLDIFYMKNLHSNKVTDNLWPLFNCFYYPDKAQDVEYFIQSAEKSGISLFTFFELSRMLLRDEFK